VALLVHPIILFGAKFQVKAQKHAREDQAHLMIRQAETVSHATFEPEYCTYFLPTQFLGPNEKALKESFLSAAYSSAPSGRCRSGANLSGLTKLMAERAAL
jgi:hypothetical protein